MSDAKTGFEEIRRKYLEATCKESNIDLFQLKSELESLIDDLKGSSEKNADLLTEAQDMLIDSIATIEESRCHPLRAKDI